MSDVSDPPVPRLPRGRGMKLSRGALVRIAMTGVLLVMVIVIARPCGDTVSKLVTGFGSGSGSGAGSDGMPRPGTVDDPAAQYERITPDMTDEQVRAVIERAKARAASNGGGSASNPGSGSSTRVGSGSARP